MARVANHPATSLTFLTYLFFSLSRLYFILSSTLPSSFLSRIILASLAFSLGIFFHISHFTFCPFSSPYSFLYSLPASLSSLYSSHFSQVSSTLSHAVHWQNYEINEWHPSRGIIQNIKPSTSPWDQIFVGRSILIKIKLAARICVALCSTIFNLLAKFGLQNFFKKILNYWNYFIFYHLPINFRSIAFREFSFTSLSSFCGAKVELFHHCHANKSVCLASIIARLSKTSSCHRYN